MNDGEGVDSLGISLSQIKGITESLKAANTQMESFITEETAADEFERVVEYDMKIITAVSRLESSIKKLSVIVHDGQPSMEVTRTEPTLSENQITDCYVKLPKLDMFRFDGNKLTWQRFWTQFESAIHLRQNLPESQKFHYLISVLDGKAAALIEGLQYSDKNYQTAVKLLKEEFGNEEQLKETHMNALIKLEPVKNPKDVKGLRELCQTVKVHTNALEALGVAVHSYAPMLMPILKRCTPQELFIEYQIYEKRKQGTQERIGTSEGESNNGTSADTLKGLITFLQEQVRCRESLESFEDGEDRHRRKWTNRSSLMSKTSAFQSSVTKRCCFCNLTNHSTEDCRRSIKYDDKKEKLREENRCFRCTRPNHNARVCKATVVCKRCKARHATSMCRTKGSEGSKPNDKSEERNDDMAVKKSCNLLASSKLQEERQRVLLQTAIAWTEGESKGAYARILFDSGSQRSFIQTSLSRRIGCKVLRRERLTVGSFGGKENESVMNVVEVALKENPDGEPLVMEAIEVDMISRTRLPRPNDNSKSYMKKMGMKIADDNDEKSATQETSLLLGSDFYWEAITGRVKRLNQHTMLVESILGWIVHGPCGVESYLRETKSVMVLHATERTDEITDAIQKFWELENTGITETKNRMHRVEHLFTSFEKTIERDGERYKVRLPWKETVNMEDNKQVAIRRLMQVSRRLQKDSALKEKYNSAMKEYFTSGVAELATSDESEHATYYMPHQAVIREDRLTTKVRIVFDASSSTTPGMSLNENLEAGENLNPDILALIMNFRKHSVAMTADVEKAFLQISIHEEDRDALRFLWWKNEQCDLTKENIVAWRMTRVTFGTTPSSFLLAATIQHHLNKEQQNFPETVEKLRNSIYVDDVMLGAAHENQAKGLYQDAKEIFRRAGMNLRKWTSNSEEMMKTFSENQDAVPTSSSETNVLGMTWNTDDDTLGYPVKKWMTAEVSERLTKRAVLQESAKVFDPLGFLTPVTVKAKIAIQRLWKTGISWDDPLTDQEEKIWRKWLEEIKSIENIKVPRQYVAKKKHHLNTELHIFSDASPAAYGSAAYMVISYENGDKDTVLILAKSKVSPMKEISLAKLELLGATLSARMWNYIKSNLKQEINLVKFWTDATIVLNWIRKERRREAFVEHRLKEIRNLSAESQWGYVSSNENPADFLTRGVTVEQLSSAEIWWKGPEWLQSQGSPSYKEPGGNEEAREVEILVEYTTEQVAKRGIEIEKFGNYSKMLRVTAWMFRFYSNVQRDKVYGPLNAEEIEAAETRIIWQEQNVELAKELKKIGAHETIRGCEVFTDEQGILRLKGRLQETSMTFNEKHPIVLPGKNHLTKLLIRHVHGETFHGGVRDTLARLRTKFWVIRGRQEVKDVIRTCIICRRYNSRPLRQEIPPLPAERVTRTAPFEIVGIDFTGPLQATKTKGEIMKVYIIIFTCAVTRAVHLETAKDTSAESFMQAFRRFIARRGMCSVIYSDNAKVFKKANKELNLVTTLQSETTRSFIANHLIKWKFIPENAPWWGGFYERLIRSFKSSLRKVIGRRLLHIDEMHTLVCEVEGIMNNRPLTYVYEEHDEPTPLTPSDLIGGKRKIGADINEGWDHDLQQVWRLREEVTKLWWQRWNSEYMKEIRSALMKPAMRNNHEKLKKGDIVLLEERNPKAFWKICLVKDIFPGRDQLSRVCVLRTPDNKVLRRPTRLVYPLEGCL